MTKLDDGGRGKVDQELRKHGFEFSEIDRRDVIDFVLADRLRIVEPLVKAGIKPSMSLCLDSFGNIIQAGVETLKNAGVS